MNKGKDNRNNEQKKEKSAWQNAKEIKAKAQQNEEERQTLLAQERETEREEYEKQLHLEKVELLKKKQGVSDDDDGADTQETAKHYTFREKVSNFFYHNKWWLALGCVFAVIVGYLIYDTVTAEKYDMYLLLISDDNALYFSQKNLVELFEANCEDANGDGEVNVALLYYAPGTEAATNNYYHTNESSLSAQFHMGDTIVVIADSTLDDTIYPQETLADLGQYIDSEHIENYGYYVNDTAFKEICGLDELLYEDMYIGLRKVTSGAPYEEEMQRNFDIALGALKGVVEDIDNYSAPSPEQ
ncbi:MAG: hypothetical protein IJO29_05395 [Oscillospiraceae bacterium]|nr:hypothetical protein [Oscillospiraceae bacterium]